MKGCVLPFRVIPNNPHTTGAFSGAIKVLSVVVGSTNRILIDVRQLRFNPYVVIALFVQKNAHGVTEAVASHTIRVTHAADQDIPCHFAHWFTVMNAAKENKSVMPGNLL